MSICQTGLSRKKRKPCCRQHGPRRLDDRADAVLSAQQQRYGRRAPQEPGRDGGLQLPAEGAEEAPVAPGLLPAAPDPQGPRRPGERPGKAGPHPALRWEACLTRRHSCGAGAAGSWTS